MVSPVHEVPPHSNLWPVFSLPVEQTLVYLTLFSIFLQCMIFFSMWPCFLFPMFMVNSTSTSPLFSHPWSSDFCHLSLYLCSPFSASHNVPCEAVTPLCLPPSSWSTFTLPKYCLPGAQLVTILPPPPPSQIHAQMPLCLDYCLNRLLSISWLVVLNQLLFFLCSHLPMVSQLHILYLPAPRSA